MFIIVIMFMAAFCIAWYWYYRNFIIPYSNLPCSRSLFLPVLRNFLMQKIPNHIPATHFYFQLFVERCKTFYSEGLCLVWLLKPCLFIFGEEPMKVFTKEPSALNKPSEYVILGEIFGEGLVTCDAEKWHKRRKLLDPAFRVGLLKKQAKCFNKYAAIFVNRLMNEEDRTGNLLEHLQFCAFSNIFEFILELKADDPKWRPEVERLINYGEKFSHLLTHRMLQPWLHPKHTLRLFSKGRKYLNVLEDGYEILMKIFRGMKDSVAQKRSKGIRDVDSGIYSSPNRSFGEIILDHHLKESSYTENDLLYEMVTFIFAGYDTVSYGLLWSLFLLGHHPEVQEILYKEIEELDGKEITYDELMKLKYLECVILESLRIYPPVPLYARQLERNVQCGKYNVPRGTTIVFFSFLYHRNPEIYPNPEKFDPERFLDGNSRKNPWIYAAFSEGIRNCIGKRLAMMEMKIVLAHIVRSFKLTSLDRREDIQFSLEIVLKPVKPLRILFTPRKEIFASDLYV